MKAGNPNLAPEDDALPEPKRVKVAEEEFHHVGLEQATRATTADFGKQVAAVDA